MIVQSMQSRRSFVTLVAASPLLAISRVRAQAPEMISRPGSGYRFLPGGPVFAGGAVAETGYEVVHALLARWLPLEQGYALVEAHLKSLGRPMHSLCGMQLRLPRQLTAAEFSEFNAPYVDRLKLWDLLYEGQNPISRTNVSPALNPPREPSLHAFSYTVAADRGAATSTMWFTRNFRPPSSRISVSLKSIPTSILPSTAVTGAISSSFRISQGSPISPAWRM